jgi:hypothetical protein
VAIVLAMLGTVLLVTHGEMGVLQISLEALLWGLSSALALAFYTVQPVALLKHHDSAVVVGWGMLVGGLAYVGWSQPWSVPGQWDIGTWAAVVFIVVMAGHRISAVNTVYFDEHALTLDASGYVTSAPFVTDNKISDTAYMTLTSGAGSVVLPNAPISGSVAVTVNVGGSGDSAQTDSITATVTGSTVSVSGYGTFSGTAIVSYQYTDSTKFARVRWMMGSDSQAAFGDLVTQFPALWTADHRLRGCAYAVVELTYSQEIFPSGVPNFSADINGTDSVLDIAAGLDCLPPAREPPVPGSGHTGRRPCPIKNV